MASKTKTLQRFFTDDEAIALQLEYTADAPDGEKFSVNVESTQEDMDANVELATTSGELQEVIDLLLKAKDALLKAERRYGIVAETAKEDDEAEEEEEEEEYEDE